MVAAVSPLTRSARARRSSGAEPSSWGAGLGEQNEIELRGDHVEVGRHEAARRAAGGAPGPSAARMGRVRSSAPSGTESEPGPQPNARAPLFVRNGLVGQNWDQISKVDHNQ